MRFLFSLYFLSFCLLLSGCAAKYKIPGHRDHQSSVTASSTEYPTLTLTVGQRIHAVTPAKGMLVGGYWLGIYVADATVARHMPRGDSFMDGTDIEAVASGRTKAFYVNAAMMGGDARETEYMDGQAWFWVDVIEPSK